MQLPFTYLLAPAQIDAVSHEQVAEIALDLHWFATYPDAEDPYLHSTWPSSTNFNQKDNINKVGLRK